MRWLLGVLLLTQAATGIAQQPSARRSHPSTQQTVTAIRRATVTISVTSPDGAASGSGFVVSSDGVIATAAHVVHGATAATVRLSTGDNYDVQGVIAIDEARDFALIRIAGFGLPMVPLGNSDSVAVCTPLFFAGAPPRVLGTGSGGPLWVACPQKGARPLSVP